MNSGVSVSIYNSSYPAYWAEPLQFLCQMVSTERDLHRIWVCLVLMKLQLLLEGEGNLRIIFNFGHRNFLST